MAQQLVCVDDYEQEARKHLHPAYQGFLYGGVDREVTLAENRSAFSAYWLLPRVLRDVSSRSQATTVLGHTLRSPIGIAPTGSHGVIHEDAESATARAAAARRALFIQSNWSNHSMQQVSAATADTPDSPKWFQLSGVPKQRHLATRLVREAEACGYSAIVLTADAPITGLRRATLRQPLRMPVTLSLPHIITDELVTEGFEGTEQLPGERWLNAAVSWHDVTWLQSLTSLPVVLKGIMSVEDALLAVKHNVRAIIVSNKGGRGLDTVPPTIHALAKICRAVGDKTEVYLDSGVRSGTDVFKALALGARAVFIGRPALWGLAVRGQEGVEHVLDILNKELDVAMALSGCCKVEDINASYITSKTDYLAKL